MSEFAIDPFADEKFSQLDLRSGPQSMAEALSPIVDEHPEFAPTAEEVIDADGAPEPEPVVPVVVTPVVTREEPESFTYPDGSTVVVDKTHRGWCATLDSGGKAPEKFYGRTKDELLTNVLAAKLHATQHIRDLNKKLKLTARPVPAASVAVQPKSRQLTPEEVTQIKDELNNNPDLAMDIWFQKKTGLTLDQLMGLVDKGQHAQEELDSEAVAKSFMAAHPEYYRDPEYKNYLTIVAFLSKEKLNATMESTREGVSDAMRGLIRGGHWTVENLEDAFEELTQDGLLELAPDESEEEELAPRAIASPPVIAAVTPAVVPLVIPTPTPDPRIASRRVGQRAGLGIRASEVSQPTQLDTTRPPSADVLDNLTDQELSDLFSGVRRAAAQKRR